MFSKSLFPVVLGVILSALVLSNLIWLNLNTHPPYYDPAGHTNLAFIYGKIFNGDFNTDNLYEFLKVSNYYPPFVHLVGGVVSSLFGYYYRYLQYFSVFVFALCAIALFLYTKSLTNSSLWAFFSTTFFILFPHIWEQSRYFMLDLPLTTLVLLCLFFLEKSASFTNARYTMLFFLFLSFAQLTKWYALLYLLIPCCFKVWEILQSNNLSSLLKRIAPFVLLSGVIVFPWYITNLKDFIELTKIFSLPDFGDPKSRLSLHNLTFYLTMISNYQIISLQFIWLVTSSIIFLKSNLRISKLFAFQILFIYLLFTFIGNKNLRYIMPLLPFLAIIMGYGVYKTTQTAKNIGQIIFAFLVLFGFGLFFINSFGIPVTLNKLFVLHPPGMNVIYLLDVSSRDVGYKYKLTKWTSQVVVDDLLKEAGRKINVLVLGNNQYLSVAGLDLFKFSRTNNLYFSEPPLDFFKSLDETNTENFIQEFDYILVPHQDVGPVSQTNYKNLESIRKYILGGKTRSFQLVKTYSLPGKDFVYLLKNIPDYNTIEVIVNANEIVIKRRPAIAKIYMQFQDKNGDWTEATLSQHETEFYQNLTNIKTIRVDYPAGLLKIVQLKGWVFDNDKQFDRVKI